VTARRGLSTSAAGLQPEPRGRKDEEEERGKHSTRGCCDLGALLPLALRELLAFAPSRGGKPPKQRAGCRPCEAEAGAAPEQGRWALRSPRVPPARSDTALRCLRGGK